MISILGDDTVIDDARFAGFKDAARGDLDGLREIMAAQMSGVVVDNLVEGPDGEDLEFIDSPYEVADDVYESDSFLAVAIKASNNYRAADASVVSFSFDISSGVVHVSDKMVTVSIFGPRKESDWSKELFRGIAERLIQANDSGATAPR